MVRINELIGTSFNRDWGFIQRNWELGCSPVGQSISPWIWGSAKSTDVSKGHLHKPGWAGMSWRLRLTSQQSVVIGSLKSNLSSAIGWLCARHINNTFSIYTSEPLDVVCHWVLSISWEKESAKSRGLLFVFTFFFFLADGDQLWVMQIIMMLLFLGHNIERLLICSKDFVFIQNHKVFSLNKSV